MSRYLFELEKKLFSGQVKVFLNGLNQNQYRDLLNEIYAKLYWIKRNPSWNKLPRKHIAELKRIHRRMSKKIKTVLHSIPAEFSTNGSEVDRWYSPLSNLVFSRYYLPNFSVHQLADNVGIWIDRESLIISTYCEGDVITYSAPSQQAFDAELDDLSSWYKDAA